MIDALSDLRVLDLSTGVAGNFCSKLLWMHGADVAIVEPPGGSPMRPADPSAPQVADDFLFRHLNVGKASLRVDPNDPDTRSAIGEVADLVDVVISDGTQNLLDPQRATPPMAVDVTIREFPTVAAYEGWSGSELIHQALSGTMFVTGRDDQPPIYGLGHRAYYATGVTTYSSVLAALLERDKSGLGQRVEVSVLESAAAMAQNLLSQYGYNESYPVRSRYPGMLSMLRCRDSWVVLFALRNWPAICSVFGLIELVDDPRFAQAPDRSRNWQEATTELARKALDFDADLLVELGQQNKVSIEKVHTVDDVLRAPQFRDRRMLQGEGSDAQLAGVFRKFGDSSIRRGVVPDVPGAGGAAFLRRLDLSTDQISQCSRLASEAVDV